ncbi:MAG: hypothetical protein AAGF13_06720 [Pseudomonadota bacterium]
MMDGSPFPSQLPLRPADEVMTLKRLGVMQPTRLSFLRVLMRNLQGAKVTRPVWNMDEAGHGHAVYTVDFKGHAYSLVAFSQALPDADRTDRVIATAWDAAFVLYDGVPDNAEIARLSAEVPRQEAGRLGPRDLVLSRANKSVRLFEHVVEALRAGQQPDAKLIDATGYLMRTTAVYANGKFGLSDRAAYAQRPGLSGPFAAEMLTVWLIRGFTHDLVEHVGRGTLARKLKRHLGIGNATGLGMAPFLVSHPLLLNAWFTVRESALARVLAQNVISASKAGELWMAAAQAQDYLESWNVADEAAMAAIRDLREEWRNYRPQLPPLDQSGALRAAFELAREGSGALQELAAAWIIEPFGELVDDLADVQATAAVQKLDAAMSCAEMRELLETHAQWALQTDFSSPEATAQFWYVSEEKLEPRLGDRATEAGADRETPLDSARQIAALHRALPHDTTPLWQFLATHPEHRLAARRAQSLPACPYAEVRANLLGQEAAPIHLLRAKLSFFGATRFDPKSRLWTRVTLAQGLPLSDELDRPAPWLPTL